MTGPALPDTGFLRIRHVLNFIPVSRSTFWEKVRSGEYPQPIKLSPKVTAWRAEDIRDLIQRLQNSSKA